MPRKGGARQTRGIASGKRYGGDRTRDGAPSGAPGPGLPARRGPFGFFGFFGFLEFFENGWLP